jgi:hypothetical protein
MGGINIHQIHTIKEPTATPWDVIGIDKSGVHDIVASTATREDARALKDWVLQDGYVKVIVRKNTDVFADDWQVVV